MITSGGSKSIVAYEKAQQLYLNAGKKYSSLLKNAMDLDPAIVKIAEEILLTGDRISVHDNKLLTRFYNELRSGSKVDKKYYDLLIGLKKAKNELDIATDHLLFSRVGKVLAEAGIPPRETNLPPSALISKLNNPDVSFLEKISLPGVLTIDMATELGELTQNGDIVVASGKLNPKTKTAKEFLKRVEKEIRETANDNYLIGDKKYGGLRFVDITPPANLLELVRLAADQDHIREIERRIDAGDIVFINSEFKAATTRGTKYLELLGEELVAIVDKQRNDIFLSKNQDYIKNEPRLVRAKQSVDSLRDSVDRHERLSGLAKDTTYGDIVDRAKKHRELINTKLSNLMTEIETISRAFLDIKKRMITMAAKEEVDVPGLLSLLVASRHLAKFETTYETNLAELESLLGTQSYKDANHGPASGHILKESYCSSDCRHLDEASNMVKDIVLSRIQSRKGLSEQIEKALTDFVLSPKEIQSFKDILCEQYAIKKHISDIDYAGGSLYQGIDGLSLLIEELVELEVEKREKIADFVHGFELAHKELWLADIQNANKNYILSNFPDLSDVIKDRAAKQNNLLVSSARKSVRETINNFRAKHKASSENFGKQLKESLEKLKNDGDVAHASTTLKGEYKKMVTSHDEALNTLEKEIGVLERKLSEFETDSKKDLEKALLTDIRKSI